MGMIREGDLGKERFLMVFFGSLVFVGYRRYMLRLYNNTNHQKTKTNPHPSTDEAPKERRRYDLTRDLLLANRYFTKGFRIKLPKSQIHGESAGGPPARDSYAGLQLRRPRNEDIIVVFRTLRF